MTVFRKAAVYLGLVDDDDGAYQVGEDYLADEGYDEETTREAPAVSTRLRPQSAVPERVESSGSVTVVRDPRSADLSKPTIVAAAVARPASADTPTVRAMPAPATRVHVLDPDSFNDAQEVGDRLKAGQPAFRLNDGNPSGREALNCVVNGLDVRRPCTAATANDVEETLLGPFGDFLGHGLG